MADDAAADDDVPGGEFLRESTLPGSIDRIADGGRSAGRERLRRRKIDQNDNACQNLNMGRKRPE